MSEDEITSEHTCVRIGKILGEIETPTICLPGEVFEQHGAGQVFRHVLSGSSQLPGRQPASSILGTCMLATLALNADLLERLP